MSDTTAQFTGSQTKPAAGKSSLAQDVKHKVSDIAHEASEKGAIAVEKGRHLAEVAGAQAKDSTKFVFLRIKENPLTSIAIAFGAGMLFAFFRK